MMGCACAVGNTLPLFVCASEKCKARGFTVIVDGRKSQWNTVKTVVLMLQVETHLESPQAQRRLKLC